MTTYPKARAALLAHLAAVGWTIKASLKIPQAIDANGNTLRFHAQAVYLGAHSMHVDIRTLTPAEFMIVYQRWTAL